MQKLIRKLDFAGQEKSRRALLRREWLITNGLGGYASSTISGCVTWRYHGLLVAALPSPFGRVVMLNHLAESIRLPDGRSILISGEEPDGGDESEEVAHFLKEFRVENQLPIWVYEIEGIVLEKYVMLLRGQNTVHVHYRLKSGQEPVWLELRPSIHFRGHEHSVREGVTRNYVMAIAGSRYEISGENWSPVLRLFLDGNGVRFQHDGGSQRELFYQKESERGYESLGLLWSPGQFRVALDSRRPATFVGSTEPWEVMLSLSAEEALAFHNQRSELLIASAQPQAREGPGAELVLAADQFIITPAGRTREAARAHACGNEMRTIIAGYHWFTDWGRDTMISLEGLTLTTGRLHEARWILTAFAHYIRDGLIPNMFPEGKDEGLYHTADASLWFFHALKRYLDYANDRATLKALLPSLDEIVAQHIRGTRFGIHVDPADGLLVQGEVGYQLTWMDAKVDDWVVTPRRGKAVEINALWYNGLRLLEQWKREEGEINAAQALSDHAERTRESFNARFWYEQGQYLYDVLDGESGADPACRPNQLLAISLSNPVLDESYWKPVLETVRTRLLTPVGLRSLSRDHPDYKSKYDGDLRARDAAYHQGTVWCWLIGPFIDAWLKVYPDDRAGARSFLEGIVPHLDEACVGSISEIFDAEKPFRPRGCIAQAWSVAEVLRCWVKTANGNEARNPESVQSA